MVPANFLYLIIFLEGYIVLSAELLAIRQTLPFVGSGTDTLSIIIAAVLMPLAFGYYAGGQFRGKVRKKLLANLTIASAFLVPGLSYFFLTYYFKGFTEGLGLNNRLLLTTIYALLFIVPPVYLLGQTVPLICNFFRRLHLPAATGKVLFFSTLGSFLGAVFTTLFLMNTIGVAHTATVTIGCASLIVLLLANRRSKVAILAAFCLFTASATINSSHALEKIGVVATNNYNTMQIEEYKAVNTTRYLRLNRSYSSAIMIDEPDKPAFSYTEYIDRYFIKAFNRAEKTGKVLVLGGGGFTIGLKDKHNSYVFVDIDPDLKDNVEKYFLKEKLEDNKKFVPQPARSYLGQTGENFDLIIVDVARGPAAIPEHLLTREFFIQVKDRLAPGGIMIAHMFGNILFQDEHSRTLHTTIESVFPYVSRQIVDGFTAWSLKPEQYNSLLYIAQPDEKVIKQKIYTDNMNKASIKQSPVIPY